MKRKMKLLEVGKDFEIERQYMVKGTYRVREIIRLKRRRNKISEKKFKEVVKVLQERYPDKKYVLKKRKIKGKVYLVIRREGYSYKNPPLYYSIKDRKLYVPKSYVRRKPKLVSAIIDMRLRDLGVDAERVQNYEG